MIEKELEIEVCDIAYWDRARVKIRQRSNKKVVHLEISGSD